MAYYLKMIGTSEDPLPVDWMRDRPEVVNGVRFGGARMPPLREKDTVIYYAVGRQRFCGILEVTSKQPTRENPASEPWTEDQKFRWPWWIGLKHRVLLHADERSPHVDELGFNVQRIMRKSYIPIGPGEFKKIEAAILARSGA